jgi:predicted esterase
MDTCILCHEEIPKMYKIPRGTSKNAQHYMRNLQKCKTSHEEIPNMHKIPRESSENAQNLMINLE